MWWMNCKYVGMCKITIEQMMKVLKAYVRNISHPEGSMVKGYILNETMGFVTKYLQEFQHVSRRIWDAEKEDGVAGKVLKSVVVQVMFTPSLQDLACQLSIHKYENNVTDALPSSLVDPLEGLTM
jgi:hypothetical protein